MARTLTSLVIILASPALVFAKCFEPSPAFPVPQWDKVASRRMANASFTSLTVIAYSPNHRFQHQLSLPFLTR